MSNERERERSSEWGTVLIAEGSLGYLIFSETKTVTDYICWTKIAIIDISLWFPPNPWDRKVEVYFLAIKLCS